jgi:hypothetical protein
VVVGVVHGQWCLASAATPTRQRRQRQSRSGLDSHLYVTRIIARSGNYHIHQQQEYQQPLHRREQTANFRVQYVGEFRLLSTDPTACTSPSPVLHAYCSGTGTLAVDAARSNPNVACSSYTDTADTNLVGVECVVDCTTASATVDCNDFYVNAVDYAQVYYSCTGATASDVLGLWEWSDTGDGTCVASTGSSTGSMGPKIHAKLARLGLVCSGSSGTEPLIDDSLADCNTALPLDDGDDYTCTSGAPCDSASTAACTIDYDDIRILSQLENAPSTCITSLTGQTFVGRIDPEPNASGGLATARFQVTMGVLANQETNGGETVPTTDCTTTGNRLLSMACTNGGTIAWNADASSATADCTTTSTGTALECTDSTGSINSLTFKVNYVRGMYIL